MLYAPKAYWVATPEELQKVCNGCGAKGNIKVPDKLFGLPITEACNIHDYMFEFGKTHGDFIFANAIFLLNMVMLITENSSWYSKLLRLGSAVQYFTFVMIYGETFFWVNKLRNKRKTITFKGEFK